MTDATRAEMTHLLLEAVSKCSRQKMRFILMSLRQKGGIDSYMSYGDLAKILQVRTMSDNAWHFAIVISFLLALNINSPIRYVVNDRKLRKKYK